MIYATLVAVSLAVLAAADAGASWPPASAQSGVHLRHLSAQQKRAVIVPLETTANECIARKVSSDPRFNVAHAGEVNELIVESVPSCLDAVRAMIDGHDRVFGDGAGETFFMGPYLDALPGAVHDLVGRRR